MYTTIRYRSIPNQFRKNEIDDFPVFPAVEAGKRIVDDSYYVPNHEANKILAKQNAMSLLSFLSYDNPKDIASGSVNVFARQKGRDLAELTQQARQLQEQAVKDVNKAIKDKQQEVAKTQSQAHAEALARAQTQVSAEHSALEGKT